MVRMNNRMLVVYKTYTYENKMYCPMDQYVISIRRENMVTHYLTFENLDNPDYNYGILKWCVLT